MEGTTPLPPEGLAPDPKDAILDAAVARLMEHFDSVQIVATYTKPGDRTTMKNRGMGNWFARYGAMRYWVDQENEISRNEVRRKGGED